MYRSNYYLNHASGLFFNKFLSLLDVDALLGISDLPAAQIVDGRISFVGSSDGLYGGVMAVQSGD